MKTKILKSKVTIEMSKYEYKEMMLKLNSLDSMISNTIEMQDVYLSDIGKLQNLRWSLQEMLDATWDMENYSYIPRRG
jgi:hypothetical protein